MRRGVTNDDRLRAAWASSGTKWPPRAGDKVKMWWKDQRGKIATVVADPMGYVKVGFRPIRVGSDKVRVKCGELVALVSISDIFPVEFSVKDIEIIEV